MGPLRANPIFREKKSFIPLLAINLIKQALKPENSETLSIGTPDLFNFNQHVGELNAAKKEIIRDIPEDEMYVIALGNVLYDMLSTQCLFDQDFLEILISWSGKNYINCESIKPIKIVY